MMWSSTYCFEVTIHQILTELCPLKISVNFSYPANSYSLHPIKLRLCKYLHYDLWWREVHIIPRLQYTKYCRVMHLKNFCNFFFPSNSYSLHLIKLKLCKRCGAAHVVSRLYSAKYCMDSIFSKPLEGFSCYFSIHLNRMTYKTHISVMSDQDQGFTWRMGNFYCPYVLFMLMTKLLTTSC